MINDQKKDNSKLNSIENKTIQDQKQKKQKINSKAEQQQENSEKQRREQEEIRRIEREQIEQEEKEQKGQKLNHDGHNDKDKEKERDTEIERKGEKEKDVRRHKHQKSTIDSDRISHRDKIEEIRCPFCKKEIQKDVAYKHAYDCAPNTQQQNLLKFTQLILPEMELTEDGIFQSKDKFKHQCPFCKEPPQTFIEKHIRLSHIEYEVIFQKLLGFHSHIRLQ
ncbi:MAG: hypothetical protein EZS28_003784 [Streblomastix strix]|uniref:Uncharacterized protein n=1 Tax=Streblomastix strix TaxID=222440 RepID=A0A5J4X0N5_9EUKA|nr:MAG: hypothetical protein EZS28_003784 [Streblomastix strix]